MRYIVCSMPCGELRGFEVLISSFPLIDGWPVLPKYIFDGDEMFLRHLTTPVSLLN